MPSGQASGPASTGAALGGGVLGGGVLGFGARAELAGGALRASRSAVAFGALLADTPPPSLATFSVARAGSDVTGGFRDAEHAIEKRTVAVEKNLTIRSASFKACGRLRLLLEGRTS